MRTEISVILPTFNEAENLPRIVPKLRKVLEGFRYEILIVDDDSPDGTYEVARDLEKQFPEVYSILRTREKGLSAAVIEGMRKARGEHYLVMDADMQHDETVIPQFMERLRSGAEIVIGSRKAKGGGIENWSTWRRFVSKVATMMAKLVLPAGVTDPMSGFFAIRGELFARIEQDLDPRGFKILLDVLAKAPEARIEEVGYVFKPREFGESKLSSEVIFQYLVALYNMKPGKYIPIRFIKYGIVGLSGVLVNQGVLWLGKAGFQWDDFLALAVAIEISIITNFFLNNFWTYKDVRLHGFNKVTLGLLKFHFISFAGALINYSVALSLTHYTGINIYITNFIGIGVATLWNYITNTTITWKTKIN